jgi:cytoskeleton protein RodZ
MSDPSDLTPQPLDAAVRPTTAGGILRQARQAQGLHIAALAAAIKVVPRKLEMLESDQFDQLPDATFTRALALTVCRTLKIDAAPVLALLPPVVHAYRLEQVAEGLKTPFHERPGRLVPKDWATVTTPVLWIAALIVILTVAVYVVPAQWLPFSLGSMQRLRSSDNASEATTPGPTTVTTTVTPDSPAASGADSEASVPVPIPEPTGPEPAATSTPDTTAAAATSEPAASSPTGALQFRTTAPSWIGVVDVHGKSLIGRLVQPGENIGLDGDAPLKVTIGNAVATQAVFKGQPVALAAHTRDNVARLDIK